jgi:hypothetical protein
VFLPVSFARAIFKRCALQELLRRPVTAPRISRLSKIDIEPARMAVHDALSGNVRLFGGEHIFHFHLGYNIGILFDQFMANALALNHFTHLNDSRRYAIRTDNRIPRLHGATGSWSIAYDLTSWCLTPQALTPIHWVRACIKPPPILWSGVVDAMPEHHIAMSAFRIRSHSGLLEIVLRGDVRSLTVNSTPSAPPRFKWRAVALPASRIQLDWEG